MRRVCRQRLIQLLIFGRQHTDRSRRKRALWTALSFLISLVVFRSAVLQNSAQNSGGGCTIVAACQVTEASLKSFETALHSWLRVVGVDNLVIVDWASTVDLVKIARKQNKETEKLVKLLRVNTRLPWRITTAYNQGFKMATTKHVFKVDCDTYLHSLSYLANPLVGYVLRYANWENAKREGEEHLNGVFLTESEALEAVGAFDERLVLYGWDDSDLYLRLSAYGNSFRQGFRKATDFVREFEGNALIEHIPHKRSRPESLEHFGICWNRLLLGHHPSWRGSMRAVCREDLEEDLTALVQELNCTLHKVAPPLHNTANVDSADCLRSMQSCVTSHNPDYIPVHLCLQADEHENLNIYPPAHIMSNSDILFSALDLVVKSDLRIFAVECFHGLGNRLRALASAAAIAKEFNFVLVVVWRPDIHSNAVLEDLFSYVPASMVTSVNLLDGFMRGKDVQEYDHLRKRVAVDVFSKRHIYVKTPFVIISEPPVNEEEINKLVRSMKVSQAVHDIVAEYAGRLDQAEILGAHIRMLRNEHMDVPGIADESPKSDKGLQAMGPFQQYRKLCDVSYFVPRIKSQLAKMGHSAVIYVATDSPEAIKELISIFGVDRVIHTSPSISAQCSGEERRGSYCLQVALAEFIILSKCNRLLTSAWSSASELVVRLSRTEHVSSGCAPALDNPSHWYDRLLGGRR